MVATKQALASAAQAGTMRSARLATNNVANSQSQAAAMILAFSAQNPGPSCSRRVAKRAPFLAVSLDGISGSWPRNCAIRRHRLTPPSRKISEARDADRRRDPSPNHMRHGGDGRWA